MKSPDIEIYLKNIELNKISDLLDKTLNINTPWKHVGNCYKTEILNTKISIVWYPKAIDSWHCLHIDNSNYTPWQDDLACAKEISTLLNIEVRCAVNSWTEDNEKQQELWYKVINDDITKIQWKTS